MLSKNWKPEDKFSTCLLFYCHMSYNSFLSAVTPPQPKKDIPEQKEVPLETPKEVPQATPQESQNGAAAEAPKERKPLVKTDSVLSDAETAV